MSRRHTCRTARARATLAAKLLKTTDPYRYRVSLGREFDDCFEMHDGDEVFRLLATAARQDPALLEAIRRHGFPDWIEKIAAMPAPAAHPTLF
jgi:hypothetical protein